jgi:tetratricopeptide (TPR) repeat protein
MKHFTTLRIGCLLLTSAFFVQGCAQPSNKSLLERGNYAMWQGRWADARGDFEKAAIQHPGDWRAQYNLGKCYMEMGEPQTASQSLAIAESLRPFDIEVADLYAASLLESGNQNKLYSYLHKRAQTQQTVRAWTIFANYAMELDDPDSATSAINTAIELSNGTNETPYIAAATFAQQLGDDALAITLWKQAWSINPSNKTVAEAIRSYGEVPGPTMTGLVDDSE